MVIAYSFEILVSTYKTTECHKPKHQNLNNHRRDNLETYADGISFLYSQDVPFMYCTYNKQSRTTDKRWSSSLGVGRGANSSSPYKISWLRNVTTGSVMLEEHSNLVLFTKYN
jgi:phenolic acid decarboxylase